MICPHKRGIAERYRQPTVCYAEKAATHVWTHLTILHVCIDTTYDVLLSFIIFYLKPSD